MPRVKNHVTELRTILLSQLEEIKDRRLSDEVIESLLVTCGDSMLLAALDLIDSKEVSKIEVASGRALYQCSGTSTTYSITLDPLFCPCPAFAQQVLYLRAQVMCKHLLATLIAKKLDLLVVRNGSLDLLATLASGPLAAS